MHVLIHHRQQRRIDENQKQENLGLLPDPWRLRSRGRHHGAWRHGQRCGGATARRSASRWRAGAAPASTFPASIAMRARPSSIRSCTEPICWFRFFRTRPRPTGLINRALIRKLSRKGPFGGADPHQCGARQAAGRGRYPRGPRYGRALCGDARRFRDRALPQDSPLWTHPKVTVTPHAAADSDPSTICAYVLRQIRNHQAGLPLENVVDRSRGY